MPFLPILLSKIKLHHVSELGDTCWVGWVCVGGVPPLVLFLPNVRTSRFTCHMSNLTSTLACEWTVSRVFLAVSYRIPPFQPTVVIRSD